MEIRTHIRLTLYALAVFVASCTVLAIGRLVGVSPFFQSTGLLLDINPMWTPLFPTVLAFMLGYLDARIQDAKQQWGRRALHNRVVGGMMMLYSFGFILTSLFIFALMLEAPLPPWMMPVLAAYFTVAAPVILMDMAGGLPKTGLFLIFGLYALIVPLEISHILLAVGFLVILPPTLALEWRLFRLGQSKEVPAH